MKTRLLVLAAAGTLTLGSLALAQTDHSGHGSHNATEAAPSASTEAFEKANAAMHEGMAIEFSGNADVDFVRSMIPHHEGAVAMARIELEHGKDFELRKLAEEIVAAQEKEIAFMKDWLAKNAPKPCAASRRLEPAAFS